MPARRAHYYRKKAEECRLHAAAAKDAAVEETLQRLAAQWERLARELDANSSNSRSNQAQPEEVKPFAAWSEQPIWSRGGLSCRFKGRDHASV